MPPRSRSPDHDDKVTVAQIVKPHGLAGELTVELYTDFPERLAELDAVEVSGQGRATQLRVESIRPTSRGRGLAKLHGVDNRDEAEKLRGYLLRVARDSIPAPPEGAYYDFQIVGLQVVTTAGKQLGQVTEIIRTGANDVYATEHALIPAVDSVIRSIDLKRGEIVIEEVAGLLE